MQLQDCMEFLSLHSLSELFDSIVTMDDAPLKPSPEPIHLAMQQTASRSAVMFGDTKASAAARAP
jgi:phosphoglycolate phosphatase-like HAD superfamily hydrolase